MGGLNWGLEVVTWEKCEGGNVIGCKLLKVFGPWFSL